MADIKVGNVSFNEASLKDISLSEAYEKFSFIRKDFVKEAYTKVNGTRSRKNKKKID